MSWLAATAQDLAPWVGGAIVVLFAVEWLTPFDAAPLWSGILVGATLLVLGIRAFTLRISDWDASRAAERGLGARDTLTTALEFADTEDEVHSIIQARAEDLVRDATPATAIPIRPQPHRLRQLGTAAALALIIGLLLLFAAFRAFMRKSIVFGLIWLLLALWVLSLVVS